jgi:cGMP-dependent protein kinase
MSAEDADKEHERITARKIHGELSESDIDNIVSALRGSLPCAGMNRMELQAFAALFCCIQFEKGEIVTEVNTLGSWYFIMQKGSATVVNDEGKVINSVKAGETFGEIALLQSCPRTATVVADETLQLWAVHSDDFRQALQGTSTRRVAETRKAIDDVTIFAQLTEEQKKVLAEAFIVQVYPPNTDIFKQGDEGKAQYILKHGELQVTIDNEPKRRLTAGAYFGERALLYDEVRSATVTTITSCECALVTRQYLEDVLGDNLANILFQNMLSFVMQNSKVLSKLTAEQHRMIARGSMIQEIPPKAVLQPKDLKGVRCFVTLEGEVQVAGFDQTNWKTVKRGELFGDDDAFAKDKEFEFRVQGGEELSKIAILTADCLSLCLDQHDDIDTALDHQERVNILRHVHIFARLNKSAITNLANAVIHKTYKAKENIFTEGEMGTRLYIIVSGQIGISVKGNFIRTISKGDYFGERALLFDEPRSATVYAETDADLWSLDKASFLSCVKGAMREYMEYRIQIQDTNMAITDLKPVATIGSGSFGLVQLVEHIRTKVRFALKGVSKKSVKELSQEMSILMERRILMEVDHPFILKLVRTFKDPSYVYFLTELVTGGELYTAIRTLGLLEIWEAQFYLGNILTAVSYLAEKYIVFRDLKPENILLDSQGYCKIIDFGCARRLQPGERAYTLVGTPYYMAPEVILGSGHTTDADLWSTGVMAYEFLCGPLPFGNQTEDKLEIFREVVNKKVEFVNCDDAAAISILKALLHRKPARRIGSCTRGKDEIWTHAFFKLNNYSTDDLIGRKLQAPLVPETEVYSDAVNPNQKMPSSPQMTFEWEHEF